MRGVKDKILDQLRELPDQVAYVFAEDEQGVDWEVATQKKEHGYNVWVRKDGKVFDNLRGSSNDAESAAEMVERFMNDVLQGSFS